MKCPECDEAGDRSVVYVGGGISTEVASQPFYDEDGVYHNHDPNWHRTEYHCSKGHWWTMSRKGGCCDDDPVETKVSRGRICGSI